MRAQCDSIAWCPSHSSDNIATHRQYRAAPVLGAAPTLGEEDVATLLVLDCRIDNAGPRLSHQNKRQPRQQPRKATQCTQTLADAARRDSIRCAKIWFSPSTPESTRNRVLTPEGGHERLRKPHLQSAAVSVMPVGAIPSLRKTDNDSA